MPVPPTLVLQELIQISRSPLAPVLRNLYDQMPEPKSVIAMGACASTGGMFNNYAVVQGVDEVVPVDLYVSGCPPDPNGSSMGFSPSTTCSCRAVAPRSTPGRAGLSLGGTSAHRAHQAGSRSLR